MDICSLKVGFLRCNCYLIIQNNECLIVDPGDEIDKIISMIGDKKLVGILVTHNHFDHVGCVEMLSKKYKVSVYDYNNLEEGNNKVCNFNFEVIYTLGHTMDSITFYFENDKIMFTGDFLFKETIGRCDLFGSDYNKMLDSIFKIKKYDDDIVIYPGHGNSSILGYEKKNNPYFK